MGFNSCLLIAVACLVAGGCSFAREMPTIENRKVWTRAFHDVALDRPMVVPLRFSFRPTADNWRKPGGAIEPATNMNADITAAGYVVDATIAVGEASVIDFDLAGQRHRWTDSMLDGQPLPAKDGKIVVHLVADEVADRAMQTLTISADRYATLEHLDVFGLREPHLNDEEARLAAIAAKDERVFYRSRSYIVFGSRVEDSVYGPPAASVPDPNTIVSPTRVIEGFEVNLDVWRPHPQGRVIDHETIWHPHADLARFPMLKTKWPTVDAAYRVALDVLARCSTDEFIHDPNDRGMWQAGFFMGKTVGFGVWRRDSTHVALRAGNRIDAAVARKTLLHLTSSGIDNGVDGVLMPIVGLWDYWLVTGDASAIREAWPDLLKLIATIDGEFDGKRVLVRAAHSTSNDAFAEPEAGGFALGTEGYFMLAYRAMAELAPLMNEPRGRVDAWKSRADQLRETIRRAYWNDEAGFFTTGPRGTEGWSKKCWESAGEELAIWPRFAVATGLQRRSILDKWPEVALNEFGADVFPYRPEIDHFRGAGWVVWTTGFASAANAEGRLDLIHHLIGQQVRNAVMNKTFYEAIDLTSGRAWRWPGQLWQAAGFLSYVYDGLLGMSCEADGLRLHAAVPEVLADFTLTNFPYRAATLDIEVQGWGVGGDVLLDGVKVDVIPPTLSGKHQVVLRPARPSDSRPMTSLKSGRLLPR